MPRLWACERDLQIDAKQAAVVALEARARGDIDRQAEWLELDQRVEAEVGLNAELTHDPEVRRRVDVQSGARLHGVGGKSEIRLQTDTWVVAHPEGDRHAPQRGEVRRWGEAGVEAAGGDGERRARRPVGSHRHVAGDAP